LKLLVSPIFLGSSGTNIL